MANGGLIGLERLFDFLEACRSATVKGTEPFRDEEHDDVEGFMI